MHQVILFALFSTRRQEEITRITWAYYHPKDSRVLVRDMKNPSQNKGNHVWCDLPPPAMAVIEAMPRQDERILPFQGDAISAAFKRACKLLGIVDLHFHDLRHEGVILLFEQGLTIPVVATVFRHRSWTSLQRYAHIRAGADKYAGWRWLPQLVDADCRAGSV
ncbi:Phage integrase family protein [Rhizobium sp. RU35A]|uniref:tyrosine-type recombinase/integrase n=1 Tax=Rhizobium sp. RU35A TaxID=1907414 RepID=UPI000955EE31|nr:Phage integrase family protein [Rhizobium sp. RU35A]